MERACQIKIHKRKFDIKYSKKAFTLIELLVVIAIIALLLSIIIPALSLVKEKSKNLQCRANIRSLAAAFRLYTETNDGKVFGYGIGRLITYGCFKFRANWEILTRSVIAPRQN